MEMRNILVERLDCERHEVLNPFYTDGLRCNCGGGYKPLRETTLPVTNKTKSKRTPLLTIELQNETNEPIN